MFGALAKPRGCCKYKSFDPTFSKVGRGEYPPWAEIQGTGVPHRPPLKIRQVGISVEIPGPQKKFLFLLLFLLAKGEKEETYALDIA